jgi:YHS domain-containing protein
MATDPVCGMEVDPKSAKHSKYYKGKMYYFCAPSCKARFEEDPEKFLKEGPIGME